VTNPMLPQTKICSHCEVEKSTSEFYPRPQQPHLFNSWCKACMKEKSRTTKKLKNGQSSVPSEQRVLDVMKSIGIWATPGREVKGFPFVDLVAWGCVGIEIKSCKVNKYSVSSFNFTPSQQDVGIRGDLVVLVREFDGYDKYHIFPSNHDIFYRSGGLKGVITHDPNAKHRNTFTRYLKRAYVTALTSELLAEYEDAWLLIEAVRLQKSAALKGGSK
jgi:hypothetical protein